MKKSPSGLPTSAGSTANDPSMQTAFPSPLLHQQQRPAAQEESASKINSAQMLECNETGTSPMDTSPTITSTAVEQSAPPKAQDPMGSDLHQAPLAMGNTTAAYNPQVAATSSLLARHPVEATDLSMLPSNPTPTPSVPLDSKEASLPLGLGLSRQTLGWPDSSTLDNHETSQQSMAAPVQLGNLHKRRAEASPEKFNTGHFEPLRPQALTSTKRIRTEDGTPRDVVVEDPIPPRTQLTAILSNFNLTPSANNKAFGIVGRQTTSSVNHEMRDMLDSQSLSTQLTAGLDNVGFATLTAYTIPLSAIPATAKIRPKRPFSLLTAFCANNELLLLLTSYLNIPSLMSLYAISKVYHHQFNCHYTAHILAIMRTWAPHSESIFSWRNYRDLCTKDPNLRQNSRLTDQEGDAAEKHGDLRFVPTLRWLQMVVYRHGVCTDILIRLASYGHRCPAGTLDALKVRPTSLSRNFQDRTNTSPSDFGSLLTFPLATSVLSPSAPQPTSPTTPSCSSPTSSSKSTCTSRTLSVA
jgi:hypothetical protein